MTKVYQPSTSPVEVSLPSEPPTYPTVVELEREEFLEKQNAPCHIHGASKTPYLDAHLHNANTKAHIHALSVALADAVHGEGCTTCAVESAGQTLTSYLRDLRAAKKSGQWSSAEKRAIKAEVKGLMKGMKRDLRGIWKNKPQA